MHKPLFYELFLCREEFISSYSIVCQSQLTQVHSAEHIWGIMRTNEAWITANSLNDLFSCSSLLLKYSPNHNRCHLFFSQHYVDIAALFLFIWWALKINQVFEMLRNMFQSKSLLFVNPQYWVECHFLALLCFVYI